VLDTLKSKEGPMKITWKQFGEMCHDFSQHIWLQDFKFTGVYGVPRGGIPVAMKLSQYLSIPMMDSLDSTSILICDDIIDSGATREKFRNHYFASLFSRDHYTVKDQNTLIFDVATDWVEFPWEGSKQEEGEDIVRRMLQYIGENPNRTGLAPSKDGKNKGTPRRVVEMWQEVFRGYHDKNAPDIMDVKNDDDGIKYHEMLIDTGYFYTHCEHHMVPFFGRYYFAYIPNEKVIGLSKIGRLIDYYGARLQVAERLVGQVVDHIMRVVEPAGCVLVMHGRHLCKEMRGVRKFDSPAEAIAVRGCFLEEPSVKMEFFSRIPKIHSLE
jgi:GTP cyclohydrolase IA